MKVNDYHLEQLLSLSGGRGCIYSPQHPDHKDAVCLANIWSIISNSRRPIYGCSMDSMFVYECAVILCGVRIGCVHSAHCALDLGRLYAQTFADICRHPLRTRTWTRAHVDTAHVYSLRGQVEGLWRITWGRRRPLGQFRVSPRDRELTTSKSGHLKFTWQQFCGYMLVLRNALLKKMNVWSGRSIFWKHIGAYA